MILPAPSLAWGPIGHQAIGLIAEAHLTPQARQAVRQMLRQESMADVSNWADAVRAEKKYYLQTSWYHFEKIDDGITYINNLKKMPPEQRLKGGVVTAIMMGIQNLRSISTPPRERIDSLKFLIHYVGDLHQPLHTGRVEDMGGNKIPVVWFGYSSSLHSVWDSGLIITGHKDILDPLQPIQMQSLAYARYLMKTQSKYPVVLGIDTERWLNESLSIRPDAYNPLYNTDQLRYQAINLPRVDFRVYQAGLRLAYVLNQIYAHAPPPPVEKDLWYRVMGVLGDLRRIISFRP